MRYSIFLIAILIAACAPKPFKGNTPSDEIAPYVDAFFEAWGQPSPEVAYNMIPLENKAAECVWNDRGVRIINIDPDAWEAFCPYQQKALVWHELGHCVLNRAHTDEESYMRPNVDSCQYIEANELALDEEMFM